MTILRMLIFAALGCVTFQILLYGSRIRGNPIGRPPIARPAFLFAKVCATLSLILLCLAAARGNTPLSHIGTAAFVFLLLAGTLLFVLAFPRLRGNLRMGLPEEETTLVTSGIYGFSRNPLYLALFCLLGASLIYAFSWLNLAAVVLAVILHHRIVLAEEKYLTGRFAEYQAYSRSVRRYL
jgi:protein-S-isoprenylcysteine O-methyltransferase Ste14